MGKNIFATYEIGKKIGFPMPAAENGFQILNLHPKRHRKTKKKLF